MTVKHIYIFTELKSCPRSQSTFVVLGLEHMTILSVSQLALNQCNLSVEQSLSILLLTLAASKFL